MMSPLLCHSAYYSRTWLATSRELSIIGDAEIAARFYPTQIASNGSACHANAYHLLQTTETLGSPLKELVHPQLLQQLPCGARFGQTTTNCHKAAFILPQATYL